MLALHVSPGAASGAADEHFSTGLKITLPLCPAFCVQGIAIQQEVKPCFLLYRSWFVLYSTNVLFGITPQIFDSGGLHCLIIPPSQRSFAPCSFAPRRSNLLRLESAKSVLRSVGPLVDTPVDGENLGLGLSLKVSEADPLRRWTYNAQGFFPVRLSAIHSFGQKQKTPLKPLTNGAQGRFGGP
jgi:hypothetical protein